MENKVIEVLDYLCEKIGIAIDWTAENVYPQVMECLGRYRTYEIVLDSLQMLIAIGLLLGVFFFWKHIIKEGFDLNEDGLVAPFILSIFGVPGIIVWLGITVVDFTKWLIIPEIQFYELIQSLIT